MQYMGSKNRISKHILPFIQTAIDNNNIETYVEPFVGGANLIDKVKCKHRIGNDIHKELISMWKELQNGWQPPETVSEEEYKNVRDNRDKYPPYYVGFVGFHATFGASYYNGYARGFKNDKVTKRDCCNEAYRNTMKQLPNLLDVEFICGDYRELPQYKNCVIYCDPPYENTKKYATKKFNYDDFWQWCRDMSKDNILFVSSYNAPDDFECIWSKDVVVTLNSVRTNGSPRTEKLFKYKKNY